MSQIIILILWVFIYIRLTSLLCIIVNVLKQLAWSRASGIYYLWGLPTTTRLTTHVFKADDVLISFMGKEGGGGGVVTDIISQF